MKKLFVLVFAIALCLGVLCFGASADGITPSQPTGDGTAADPYKITTAEELYWFAGLVNGTLTDVAQDTDADAVLTADITINTGVLDENGKLNGNGANLRSWTPIGNNSNRYTGTFDGNDKTISGLYYSGNNGSGNVYAGLFGCVGSDGKVKNVKVADSYIMVTVTTDQNQLFVGGVCGQNYGTITNCSNAGTVTGAGGNGEGSSIAYVGGVCGANYGTITNCCNSGSVIGSGNVGGVCGTNGSVQGSSGTIENCSNSGDVGGYYAGGVCGQNFSAATITNCYNIGSVSGYYIGGVCGLNGGAITNCYNIGSVSGYYIGGVCGQNYGTITNCYRLSPDTIENDASAKTEAQFASGEVAWLLNSDQEDGPWRQTVGTDTFPVLNSTHQKVVKLTVDSTVSYHNKGYTFSGETDRAYFKKDGTEIKLPYTVNEDTELTSAAIYTVTVVYDNGTADTKEQVVDGGTFKLPDAPDKSGYTFLHWSDGSNTYDPGDSVNVNADMTFTAVWREINIPTPNSITVTQPANGSVKTNPSNGSAGTLITVTATPDEGYELAYITVDGERITGNTFRMPDKAVTVSAVFVPVSFPFTDVKPGDWFYDAVKYVYYAGLMDGVEEHIFAPNDTLTRAMVWTIIARAEGVDTDGGATWYAKAQQWVVAKGISDGENPSAAITRQELVTMLWRLSGEPVVNYTLTSPDADAISGWAYEAMRWAVSEGIIEGDENGLIHPTATCTRAEAAAILMRLG